MNGFGLDRVYLLLIEYSWQNSINLFSSVFVKPLESYTDSLINMIDFYKYFTQSNEHSLPILLLHGPSGSGKTRIVESVCSKQSLHLCQVSLLKV
jgi:Cdc6-like AAA superfamily ATPase